MRLIFLAAPLLLAGCVVQSATSADVEAAFEGEISDAARQVGQAAEEVAREIEAQSAAEWPSDGRDYTAQRYSPLTQIDASNVGQLGLAWFDQYDTFRGVEATPIYADGVLYNTLPFNITIAYDATTGERLWTYDPEVPREFGRFACCEPVSRGLAMHGNKVIIATLDGRLIALDKASGQPVWSTRTFPLESGYAYSITGAPRVFGDKVVVGQSGGDFGVRGFAAAFDVETGEQAWKFYLTPPAPGSGPDGEASDPVMPMAAATWFGTGWHELGGGANPWDSIAYDPELDLVYVGTANTPPTPRTIATTIMATTTYSATYYRIAGRRAST
jgi:quinohemoprotein ethanol dehydrogenase